MRYAFFSFILFIILSILTFCTGCSEAKRNHQALHDIHLDLSDKDAKKMQADLESDICNIIDTEQKLNQNITRLEAEIEAERVW